MKPRVISRFAVIALLLGWVAVSAAQIKPRAQSVSNVPLGGGFVSEWTGQISLQLPGKPSSKPKRGERLPVGTLIETHAGIMVLTLKDDSQILIRPHTRLVLKQPARGDWEYLKVIVGWIRAYITIRTGGAPPFELGTPSAVVAVRGTRFNVIVNKAGTTEVDVFKGLVEVAGIGIPGKSVLVRPGFSTRVAVGKPPITPVPTYDIRPGASPPSPNVAADFSREENHDNFSAEGRDSRDSDMNESDSESGSSTGTSSSSDSGDGLL
jgi:hypothetical protein